MPFPHWPTSWSVYCVTLISGNRMWSLFRDCWTKWKKRRMGSPISHRCQLWWLRIWARCPLQLIRPNSWRITWKTPERGTKSEYGICVIDKRSGFVRLIRDVGLCLFDKRPYLNRLFCELWQMGGGVACYSSQMRAEIEGISNLVLFYCLKLRYFVVVFSY